MDDDKLPDTILIIADDDMVVLMTGSDENGIDHRICIQKKDVDIICLWMKQKALECNRVKL